MRRIFEQTRHSAYLLAVLLAAFLVAGCNREDDIDEIFIGRTWYMNGGMLSGRRINAEVKNFFVPGQPSAYSITFGSGVFTGMLQTSAPFSGTWTVDGHNHTITLKFNEKPAAASDFDRQVYNVLKDVTRYESGETFLKLIEDKDNSVMFGNKR